MSAHRSVLAALLTLAAAGCMHAPVEEVRPAPPFELPELSHSGTLKLSDLKGKVVILDFWATWCGPCIAEIPEYTNFWQRNHTRGVEVVGVVVESGERNEIEQFVHERGIPYRQVVGTDAVEEAYGVNQGLPTTFVIDADGKIRARTLGSDYDKFRRLQETVDGLLTGKGQTS